MKLRTILLEDCSHYKDIAMVLFTCYCDFKCCKEAGIPVTVCQNSKWAKSSVTDYDDEEIIRLYLSNPFSKAIVFAGFEPFLQIKEVQDFIKRFRQYSDDVVIIYTGYNKEEVSEEVEILKQYKNVIVKFGRYIPNCASHFDEILGVDLASDNQYAEFFNE